ncbi:hypothetical protein [Flavobacterium reichenbachii]|uniref:Uncharacterized protein n=1 Tax=Flavobacterium reichenbachii TaxID=362418 RepID=A0A085ZK76_9FLAO|nr:hypothetical protein [Flavobacterium reichenbachii]KFF04840.1 hypothetical protein IW19_04530 [Flavobacterium reichenbachii]OXB12173.1 hypothetical protein B0A68_19630 [Flavobacterium reichenbachii]
MKTKHLCLFGLLFFLISYVFFSNILLDFKQSIDFAHWFNLIGACLLSSFNDVFPKNKLSFLASIATTLGVIAHVGLCTIDFIMWSYQNNEIAKQALSVQISNTPSIFYPFIVIGPSLLFIGLSLHALNFIKSHLVLALMVAISSIAIGFSFFVLKDGIYMLLSCVVFVSGLGFLICKNDNSKLY